MNHYVTARLLPRQKPDPTQLLEELQSALRSASGAGVYDKLQDSHDVLRCHWAGQSADGKKHGTNVKPWENAIDTRVREAAKVTFDTVKLMMKAVRSGATTIEPVEHDDYDKAQMWQRVFRHFTKRHQRQIHAALKQFFACVQGFGYGVLHVDWVERKQLVPKTVTVEAVLAHRYAQRRTETLNELQSPELPPELDADLTQDVALEIEELRTAEGGEVPLSVMLREMDVEMPPSEALKAARQLMKKPEAVYYRPVSLGGAPLVKALIPFVHVIHGVDLSAIRPDTVFAMPERISAVELEQRAAANGWKVDLQELLKCGNTSMLDADGLASNLSDNEWLLNGLSIGLKTEMNDSLPWYEIVTVYRMAVNEAGIPSVYISELFPAKPDMLLSHECSPLVRNDGELGMPFVIMTREPSTLAIESTGISLDLLTDQLTQKKLWDGTVAAAELAAFPPSQRMAGDEQAVMPGSTLAINPRQSGTAGAQSRFLDVPGVDAGALKAIEMSKAEVKERYHRGADADPDLRSAYEEDLGHEAVAAAQEMFTLIWAYIQAYVTPEVATRIANRPTDVALTDEDLQGRADIEMSFNSVAMNGAKAKEQMELVKNLLTFGSPRVNVDAAVEEATRSFSVTLAERIIIPSETGSANAEQDERQAITEMQSGFEVKGRQNAPETRLGAYREWMNNPDNIDACLMKPGFYELVVLRMKGLEMQVQQQTTNKVIGQTGQKPPAFKEAQPLSDQLTQMVEQRQQQIMMQQQAPEQAIA